jgi:hypothetical protein
MPGCRHSGHTESARRTAAAHGSWTRHSAAEVTHSSARESRDLAFGGSVRLMATSACSRSREEDNRRCEGNPMQRIVTSHARRRWRCRRWRWRWRWRGRRRRPQDCCRRRGPYTGRGRPACRVSQGWVSRLVARYRAEGEAASEPRSRRHRTSPTAPAADTVELIVRIRKELIAQGLDAGPDLVTQPHCKHGEHQR